MCRPNTIIIPNRVISQDKANGQKASLFIMLFYSVVFTLILVYFYLVLRLQSHRPTKLHCLTVFMQCIKQSIEKKTN
jgi:flagellar biogenesis protein FliO